jgi:phenylacetate-CoA ligase
MDMQPRGQNYYDRIEIAPVEALRALQLERLQWSVRHAYANVEHYRASFDAAGVRPDDLQSLDDLAKFPFTAKKDLRDTYPFGLFAVPLDRIARIHASSGTTGKPIIGGYTAKDIDTWAGLIARSIHAAGGRPGDRVQVSYGYGLFTGGLGAHYGAEKLGCTVIPMSGGQTEKQVQMIRDLKPRIIMVTPSYMLNIIDEFKRQGIDPRTSSLEIGIFGAEPWTNTMRAAIEERAGIDALDIYGLTEVMGPGVASECVETKDGPTIWEDHFYPEIIDPDTGEALPDHQPGELVFTSLTKEALPIIRYRTRDLSRLGPPTARGMRRFEKVTGRSDDMLIIRGVNVFPSQLEEIICRQPYLSPHFHIQLSRRGNMDHVNLTVECAPNLDTQNVEDEAAHLLQKEIKTHIGISVEVAVAPVGSIPRSAGKASRVTDNRQ